MTLQKMAKNTYSLNECGGNGRPGWLNKCGQFNQCHAGERSKPGNYPEIRSKDAGQKAGPGRRYTDVNLSMGKI